MAQFAALILFLCLAEAPSALPPAARELNEQAVALIERGEHLAALPTLRRAYESMPDPLAHRAGRGTIMGTLFATLRRLYADTHDPGHLCELRTLLTEHDAALRNALGARARPDETAGTLARLREVEATLATLGPEAARCESEEPPPLLRAQPPPDVPRHSDESRHPDAPPHPDAPQHPDGPRSDAPPHDRHASEPGRPLRITGAVLIAGGVASLATMTYALVVHRDDVRRIRDLDARLVAEQRPGTPDEDAEVERRFTHGQRHAGIAVATGIAGTVSVGLGITLALLGRRARLPVVPVIARDYLGLSLSKHF